MEIAPLDYFVIIESKTKNIQRLSLTLKGAK